jgi:hypothetical protein
MIVDLSKVTFTNDFFSLPLPEGSTLVLNKIDESLLHEESSAVIKEITIEIWTIEEQVIHCPCVIGLGNDLMQITTDHKEYEGKVLTPENMEFCTIEVYGD